MASPWQDIARGRVWLYALSLLAGAVGAKFGYDFGAHIGGMLIGWVAALSSALFATLMAAAALDQLVRLFGRGDHRP
jgi:membrane associated rhomboid family serine protease